MTEPSVTSVRAEKPADAEPISRVVGAAFESSTEPRLVALLRARGEAVLSLVAEKDGQLVGHVMASPIAIEPDPGGRYLGIAPLAVVPALQGRGIGSQLMKAVIERARECDVDALFLLGSPRYYPRFGFVESHVANQYGATDAFMHLELRRGCLGGVEGLARYVTAFRDVEA